MEKGFLEEKAAGGTQRTEKQVEGQMPGQKTSGQRAESGMRTGRTPLGGWLTLTEEGLGLSDCLGPELISPEIRKKMEEWDDIHKSHDSLQGQSEKL